MIIRQFFKRCVVSICILCSLCMLFYDAIKVQAQQVEFVLTSPSVILMEASTGTVLYEKNPDEVRSPASITKIMTLLLVFEALESGRISLEDEVVTSAYAKSMGGSQVFLEEGEVQTVDTLIKCISVASGNDASVAMAEHIAGSEEAFVTMMNEKAKMLGMDNTTFMDCCGLTADSGHHTTARDVAIMSKELITKYPKIYDYTNIWMEDIVHVTKQGTKTFTLASTNKLLKQYQWATGLKTGSTSTAKYCLSATANKDGIDLIAVIMGAPDYKVRFEEAKKLLEYGFSIAKLFVDKEEQELLNVKVAGGKKDSVAVAPEGMFYYLDTSGADFGQIEKYYEYAQGLEAPIEKGMTAGKITYMLQGKELGSVKMITVETVEKAYYVDCLWMIFREYLL